MLKGVLPLLAATLIFVGLLAGACGFIQAELTVASAMKYAELQKAINAVFIVYLFLMATGIVPCAVLKLVRVRNALIYLFCGAVAGLLAEHCYFVENDVWDTWDFSAPQFTVILMQAIHDIPLVATSMVPMLPESAIPVGLGLIGGALFWIFAVRRKRRIEQPNRNEPHVLVPR
jgi:hypothetical protein